MHAAQLASITDIDTLRRIALQNLEALQTRDAEIARHQSEVAARDALIAERDRTIVYKTARIDALVAEMAKLRRMQFAARSEKMDPAQRTLFDETMAADLAAIEVELESLQRDGKPRAPRSTPKRRALPPELPRIEVRHEPASCQCAACGGALVAIGEHVNEKLDVEPLNFFVHRHVYPQYACRTCATVTAEPVAPAIIDRGIAAPGLLAHVTVSKYVDHQPLYRLETIFARNGIEIGRTTQSEWIGVVGVALTPLAAALHDELLGCAVLHADETPVAQLDPGRGRTKRAYLFAYRTAVGPPIVVFDYGDNRSGKHIRDFLGSWKGALMVDDYGGYDALWRRGVTELGCWVHARRKFVDLHKANKSTLAAEAIERIAELYAIEKEARDLSCDERYAIRQAQALPLVESLKKWLERIRPTVLGASGTLAAIDYTLKRWEALARYLDDGRYPIDNNPVENAIRPIALGRKNWLFAGSERAGERAAVIMSLLATAKSNRVEPYAWLRDVLTRLPTTKDADIASLLPHRWIQSGT